MAVQFPSAPSDGQSVSVSGTNYVWSAAQSRWNSNLTFDLSAVSSDILPDADSSRSLGSTAKKWKALHLSANTLFLGDSGSISSGPGGGIILPSLTVGTGTNSVKLEATSEGGLAQTGTNSSGTTAPAKEAGAAKTVTDMPALVALSGMATGETCLVTSLNRIFMYTGSGWFKIADMTNESPTAITGVDGTYALEKDGTATVITAVSTDPEGFPLTWSYAVTTGSLGSTATVGQDSSVFTITPSTADSDAGTFGITFSVTDGATGAVNAVSQLTLLFSSPWGTKTFLFGGSLAGSGNTTYYMNQIEYYTHSTGAGSTDFGDLTDTDLYNRACAVTDGSTILIGNSSKIHSINAASHSNSTSFGTKQHKSSASPAWSDGSRAVWGPGSAASSPWYNVNIDYSTIATSGNATSFGTQSGGRVNIGFGAGNTVRMIYATGHSYTGDNGGATGYTSDINYITIATTGNATFFGEVQLAHHNVIWVSNDTRAVVNRESNPNTLDYITIATLGNATDFGNMLLWDVNGSANSTMQDRAADAQSVGTSDKTYGHFNGNQFWVGSLATDMVQRITIDTLGNATDFMNLSVAKGRMGGCTSG